MAKNSAIVFGIIFVIAGIWGWASSPILGVFAADTVSSIVHIIVGLILLWVGWKAVDKSVVTLKTIGIIYIIFAVIGFVQGSSVLGIFATNAGADWLYLILGVVMAVLGFSAKGGSMSSAPQM